MRVNVPVEGLWLFFQTNRDLLSGSYMLLAENDDGQVEIYLTEEDRMPYFHVEVDGQSEYESSSVSKVDAERVYKGIIDLFLSEDPIMDGGAEVLSPMDIDRLNEIRDAAYEFLSVLTEDVYAEKLLTDDQVDDIVSDVVRYLGEECGYSIRYPTIIEDEESGLPTVVQYPYG